MFRRSDVRQWSRCAATLVFLGSASGDPAHDADAPSWLPPASRGQSTPPGRTRRRRLFWSLRSTLDVMLQHRVPDLTYKQLAAVREALTNTERYFSQAGIGPTPDMDIFDARFFTTLEGLDWLRLDLDSIREATPHGEPD